jgi:response regulator RpfG family c-di-GMP phosphodiesterase
MLDELLCASAVRLRGLRVLIVEDTWHIAKALDWLLAQVIEAVATTSDAERLADELAPNVAVVDMKLRDRMAYGLIDSMILALDGRGHGVRYIDYVACESSSQSEEAA